MRPSLAEYVADSPTLLLELHLLQLVETIDHRATADFVATLSSVYALAIEDAEDLDTQVKYTQGFEMTKKTLREQGVDSTLRVGVFALAMVDSVSYAVARRAMPPVGDTLFSVVMTATPAQLYRGLYALVWPLRLMGGRVSRNAARVLLQLHRVTANPDTESDAFHALRAPRRYQGMGVTSHWNPRVTLG
jgi:hypothetical protein